MQQGEILDQLWYTWSKNGLDSMAMGYRVRAASGELRNTQSMRYRVLDRFLRYDPPQGININEFNAQNAPLSFAFLANTAERLLIRKVFKGRDLAGRNSVFFTHLIAGLPDEFTARDAIRLWDLPLWVDSEDQKAANDTLLDPLPYAELKRYTDQPRRALPLDIRAVRHQLEELLLSILNNDGPYTDYIYLVGNANLAAALIYGLTHCLPLSLLGGNFFFSTYESSVSDDHIPTIITTISGPQLANESLLEVRPKSLSEASATTRQKCHGYVQAALGFLFSTNPDALLGFLKKMEERNCQSADQLIDQFNLAYGMGELNIRQVELIIEHPDDYIDRLQAPAFQQQSAALLLGQQEYWEKRGKQVLGKRARQVSVPTTVQGAPLRLALTDYFAGLGLPLSITLQNEFLYHVKELLPRGKEVAFQQANYYRELLDTLLPPEAHVPFWLNLLATFAQPPLYSLIKSDAFWNVQLWLLARARLLPNTPQLLERVRPWLDIPSWEKLEEACDLPLPQDWVCIAIQGRMRSVAKGAVPFILRYEQFCIYALYLLLRQGGQASADTASEFFRQLVEYSYPHRVPFLLALVNTYFEAIFVQTIFDIVGIKTAHPLQESEVVDFLAQCRPEVIATCTRALALTDYLQEWISGLTPARLGKANAAQVLGQIKQIGTEQGGFGLPNMMVKLADSWLIIHQITMVSYPNLALLQQTAIAIGTIFLSYNKESAAYRRDEFATEFLEFLIPRITTEEVLEEVLETLHPFLGGTHWDLLRGIASRVGKKPALPSILSIYIIWGIKEAERASKSDQDLDSYLHLVYDAQSREAHQQINAALSRESLPLEVRLKWVAWRESIRARIPLINVPLPTWEDARMRLKRSKTGSLQLEQAVAANQPASSASPAAPPGQENAQGESSREIIVRLPAIKRTISTQEYITIHGGFGALIRYWLHQQIPSDVRYTNELLNDEINALRQIYEDLTREPQKPSHNLLIYLAEDALLTEAMNASLGPYAVTSQKLDPARHVAMTLPKLQAFLQKPVANISAYENGLLVLIRRYLIIMAEGNTKKELKKALGNRGFSSFLKENRSSIHIELFK